MNNVDFTDVEKSLSGTSFDLGVAKMSYNEAIEFSIGVVSRLDIEAHYDRIRYLERQILLNKCFIEKLDAIQADVDAALEAVRGIESEFAMTNL